MTAEVVLVKVRAAVGRYGEKVAAAHLEADGMDVLNRNWRCRIGEIDIVALDQGCVVICEVKTRRTRAFGSPVEAVTASKQQRLRRLAGAWLAEQAGTYSGVRIDIVAVWLPARGSAVLEHLRGVC